MKTLNHIVADLEYCKELKELGLVQNSIIYWEQTGDFEEEWELSLNGKTYYAEPEDKCISAWTDTELGYMLKPIEDIEGNVFEFSVGSCDDGDWICVGFSSYLESWDFEDKLDSVHELYIQDCKTPSEARAKMIIYLLKNNIISLEEVNKNI